jgi:hypothetical protein
VTTRDEADEPLGDRGDRAGRVGADPGVPHEAREPGALRQVLEPDRPKERGDAPGQQAGEDPADDENDGEPEDSRERRQEHLDRAGERGADGKSQVLHAASGD